MTEPVKVVFILGPGRTGSTLLLNILGDVGGFFAAGELRHAWARLFRPKRQCTCRKLFSECEVWGQVIARNFGLPEGVSADEMERVQKKVVRVRYVGKLLKYRPGAGDPEIDQYLDASSRMYRTVADITGANVIVNSSKHPGEGALLRMIPGVEAYYVHLVRDPRAVAYSWQRTKQAPDRDREMRTRPPVRSAFNWVIANRQSERVTNAAGPGRSIRVRYEDLVARPRQLLSAILEMVGEPAASLPLTDDQTAELGQKHIMGGNPNRFTKGTIQLKEDREWLEGLSRLNKVRITAITSPVLHRYGYPVRPGPALPLA